MGFLKKKTNLCKICKSNPASRFCLQKGKDICWVCCNEIRINGKCPTACKYHLEKIPTDLRKNNLKISVDSLSEYEDLQKRFIDLWVLQKQKIFNDEIPLNMAETSEGKKKIEEYLQSIKINESEKFSYRYLIKRLNLTPLSNDDTRSYESVIKLFLDNIIVDDYEKIPFYFVNFKHYSQKIYFDNFIKRFKKIKNFKSLKDYFIVGSGINKDGKSALVHTIINYKLDLVIILLLVDEKWKIANFYFGKPEMVNSESEVYKSIALFLNQNKKNKALELLDKQSEVFPQSADIQYYYGIYFLNFAGNFSKAITHYFNSIEIDPNFSESYFGLATAYLLAKDNENAKKYYELAFQKNKEDFRALNNLATIYFEEENFDLASEFVKKALKLNPDFELAKKNKERIDKKNNEF